MNASFIHKYWGDLIALHLIYLGIALVWLAHGDADIAHIGESLMFSGAMTLRFRATGQKPQEVIPNGGRG